MVGGLGYLHEYGHLVTCRSMVSGLLVGIWLVGYLQEYGWQVTCRSMVAWLLAGVWSVGYLQLQMHKSTTVWIKT